MNIEQEIIISILKMDKKNNEISRIKKLLKENINYQYILGFSFENRIYGIIWYRMREIGVHRMLPKEVQRSFEMAAIGNAYKNKIFMEEIERINTYLKKNKIEFVFLKGAILNNIYYESIEIRSSSDIDLLVNYTDLKKIDQFLCDEGYCQGRYDEQTNKISEVRRKDKIFWLSQTHQTYPYRKIINDEYINRIKIDINYSINFGEGLNELDKKLTKKFIDERNIINNWPSLNIENLIIMLCNHVYKEAISPWEKKDSLDLSLYKFYDVYYLIMTKPVNWYKVLSTSREFDLMEPVQFVLSFIKNLFAVNIPIELSHNNNFDVQKIYNNIFNKGEYNE